MKQKFTSNGWLVVNKPEGVESFGVIRKLKFRYQFHKIGFAGTLDPLASGILLIGINKATPTQDLKPRIIEAIMIHRYRAISGSS